MLALNLVLKHLYLIREDLDGRDLSRGSELDLTAVWAELYRAW